MADGVGKGGGGRRGDVDAGALWVYAVAAYLFAPLLWEFYLARRPSLRDLPGVTHTRAGIPGDPLNVALVGTEQELQNAMRAANWVRARPLGWRSDSKLAESTLLRRADPDAPVSRLYLFGRPEDLAFEQPVGPDPRQRHHVRFWRTDRLADDDRPIWIGSATFDRAVGLSHTTGQITHHIDGDVDAERDHLLAALQQTGLLARSEVEPGFHQTLSGRNGGGDRWHTDGDLRIGVIAAGAQAVAQPQRNR